MSTRTTRRLRFLFIGGAAVLFDITLWWTYGHIGRAIEQDRHIGAVSKGVFELTTVTNDYLLHRTKRAEEQWANRFASLSILLSRLEVPGGQERNVLNRITKDLQNLLRLFTQLQSAHER